MMLQPFVEQVAAQLAAAAALGDERTRRIADGLADAAAAAVRLAVLSAVSTAADEISRGLLDAPGAPSVAVRLDGEQDEAVLEVRCSEPQQAALGAEEAGDATARISLRLSDGLKAAIEGAARRDGVSVNTWLVRAAGASLTGSGTGTGAFSRPSGRPARLTGWINQ
jgi:hypothetical protein